MGTPSLLRRVTWTDAISKDEGGECGVIDSRLMRKGEMLRLIGDVTELDGIYVNSKRMRSEDVVLCRVGLWLLKSKRTSRYCRWKASGRKGRRKAEVKWKWRGR